MTDADITHRRHAIIESVFADPIDGPWAHQPPATPFRQFGLDDFWAPELIAMTKNGAPEASCCSTTHHRHQRSRRLRSPRRFPDPHRQGVAGRKCALATALVGFAADVRTRVVAEGVEEAAELAVLRHLAVPWAQGYYLGRPQPAAPARVV